MVWKMPKDQRERGRGGGRRGALQIYFKAVEERRGTSIFLPFPPPPSTKAQYQSREDPRPPAPQPCFARV